MILCWNPVVLWFFSINCVSASLYEWTDVVYLDEAMHVTLRDKYDPNVVNFRFEVKQSQDFLHFTNCSKDVKQRCFQFTHELFSVSDIGENCINLNFTSYLSRSVSAEVHFGDAYLYGGAEHSEIAWPADKMALSDQAYITTPYHFQAVVEYYWLSSNGYYLYVDEKVPLFVSLKNKILTLVSHKKAPYIKVTPMTALNLTLCKFENAQVAQHHAVLNVLGKPNGIPDILRVREPIWSTWVKFKDSVNEVMVLDYAKEISKHGYTGQIEIDDHWETCYGSLVPNPKKFTDFKKMIAEIKAMNFRVTVWIHPFVNEDCEPTYSLGKNQGYFVKGVNNSTSTQWWRGRAAMIDFTNSKASKWFKKRLKTLKVEYGVNSFKFDAGESDYMPSPGLYHKMDDEHPHKITKAYVKFIASLGTNVHTRVAKGTQKYPIFVTMMDRESHWGKTLGIGTMIPQLLHLNILGYSFVLPDMIGGNQYSAQANEELFIRWVQLNVFMPSMQFSVLPWDYGKRCSEITKKFVDLHHQYADKIIEKMKLNVATGTPVNPPIWWISPKDPVALECDSEFLLGDEILVAPILHQGATTRNIYLPFGYWKDENNPDAALIRGPIWLNDYHAPLDVLPYFSKVNAVNVQTLVYLNSNDYSNLWPIATVSFIGIGLGYVFYLMITRCFKLRKRVLLWCKSCSIHRCRF